MITRFLYLIFATYIICTKKKKECAVKAYWVRFRYEYTPFVSYAKVMAKHPYCKKPSNLAIKYKRGNCKTVDICHNKLCAEMFIALCVLVTLVDEESNGK